MLASRRLAQLAAWGLVAYLVFLLASNIRDHQWDFESYYVSAQAFAKGANPYDLDARAAAAGRFSKFPFTYPPLVLYALLPFGWMPYPVAFEAFLLLKLLALAALLWLWQRHFVPLSPKPALLLLLVLAFNGTLFQDLIAGNLSIFEELGLWLALAALLKGRDGLFAVALGVTAQLKLLPALLLLTALVVPPRPRWRAFLGGAAVCVSLLALNLAHRELLPDFLARARALGRGGPMDPSSYSLVELLRPHFLARRDLDAAFYAGLVLLFAVVAARSLWRLRAWPVPNPRLAILIATTAYALALPRLKGYSYIVLIPAALHVIQRARHRVPLAAVLVALPLRASLLPFGEFVRLGYLFLPWLAAAYLLFELAREASAGERHLTPPGPGALAE